MPPASRKVVLLLPGHGIEDLPLECEEDAADQLLSGFALLTHPALVAACGTAPGYDRADHPPPIRGGDVVIIPSPADDWLEPTFAEECRQAGASVLHGLHGLDAWSSAAAAAVDAPDVPVKGVHTFLALGLTRLMLMRLARRMHIFDELDELRWHTSLKTASEAWRDGETAAAETSLGQCFEQLLEFREQIHPVDPALIDGVLVEADAVDAVIAELDAATPGAPPSLLGDLPTWTALAAASSGVAESVTRLWPQRAVELIVGDAETAADDASGDTETRLRPLEQTGQALCETARGIASLFGRPPRVWGRATYGLHPQLPQMLQATGFEAALHQTFDVGLYPDAEDASQLWQAPDRSRVQAMSRLPLPAGRAATVWQLPERLAETIEADAAAGLMLLRTAGGVTPWLDLLKIAASVAPVLGRFQTAGEFLVETDSHASVLTPQAREYASASLARRAAADLPDPISRVADQWQKYLAGVRSHVCGGLADLIGRSPADPSVVEAAGSGAARLASRVSDAGTATAETLCNPLPMEAVALTASGPRVVPPFGFLTVSDADRPSQPQPKIIDEGTVLRNELLELHLSRRTGGIQRLLLPGRRGNLLSQQLSRRLCDRPEGEYAAAVCEAIEPIEDRDGRAALRTRGTLEGTDVRFTQTFRLGRARSWCEIDVELEGPPPLAGNPWVAYDAVRWAWAGEATPRSMSCDFDAFPCGRDRLESPLFVQIHDEPPVTLLFGGLPFHRFSSGRSLDTLLRVHGETRRTYTLGVGVGSSHPAELAVAAAAANDPAMRVRTAGGQRERAWLMQFDRAGVLALRVSRETGDDGSVKAVVRLRETDGSSRPVRVRLFRPVREGFARDLVGRLTDRLTVVDGAVDVRLRPHQMRDVVLTLD